MERMKTRNMNPAKAFYDEGEGSGEHGGKGIDDRERYRIPSANFIVATLHWRDCSFRFDLSSDEISATGSRQSFAHFDSRKR